jgi:uncharacterized protein (UPF0332 family)
VTADALLAKAVQAARSTRTLLEQGDTDGACNRAYFAMFDAARAVLLAGGQDTGRTHKGMINAFGAFLLKDARLPRETGRLLKRAEAFRYVADYSDAAVDRDEAAELIRNAETFVAAVQSLLAPPAAARE